MTNRTDLGVLTLPFERIETIHAGASEVRRYRNELTGLEEVGKRFDTLGVETAVAVQEGALLQRIRHDNLVPVFSVAELTEGPNTDLKELRPIIEITMPYYARGSVCDTFARGERFTLEEAREIATAALFGLAELHDNHGVLHRDVKTPNVFLMDPEDRSIARLGDLGAAAFMDNEGTAEGINAPQLWTAPENYTDGCVSVHSDLYSMGVVLFELLHGPLPYEAYDHATKLERLNLGRSAFYPRHFELRPEVPRGLRRVIRKATRVEKAGRYDSAHKMIGAIARVPIIEWTRTDSDDVVTWEGESVSARPISFRVTARWRPRLQVWRVQAERFHTRAWQRTADDVDLDQLSGPGLAAVFDGLTDSIAR